MEDIVAYLGGHMPLFWLIIALFFFLLEIAGPGLFFFLSFFIGALGAMAASFLTDAVFAHIIAFFGATIIAFAILKLWVQKNSKHIRKTNAQALVGKKGFVVQTITPEAPGFVKIGGETWLARTSQPELLEIGTPIEVIQVVGAHLIVTPSK